MRKISVECQYCGETELTTWRGASCVWGKMSRWERICAAYLAYGYCGFCFDLCEPDLYDRVLNDALTSEEQAHVEEFIISTLKGVG